MKTKPLNDLMNGVAEQLETIELPEIATRDLVPLHRSLVGDIDRVLGMAEAYGNATRTLTDVSGPLAQMFKTIDKTTLPLLSGSMAQFTKMIDRTTFPVLGATADLTKTLEPTKLFDFPLRKLIASLELSAVTQHMRLFERVNASFPDLGGILGSIERMSQITAWRHFELPTGLLTSLGSFSALTWAGDLPGQALLLPTEAERMDPPTFEPHFRARRQVRVLCDVRCLFCSEILPFRDQETSWQGDDLRRDLCLVPVC